MADFKGTSGADVLDQTRQDIPAGSNIFGGAGDDIIVFTSGNALGEAGNDTITATEKWNTVAYWNSPAAINVNLTTGVAQDGFGGTDKLINVHSVSDSAFDDQITGSAGDDIFWLSWGSNTVKGGGGTDIVKVYNTRSSDVVLSYDAKTDTFTMKKNLPTGDKGTDLLSGVASIEFIGPDSDNVTVTRDMFTPVNGFLRSKTIVPGKDMAMMQQIRLADFDGDGKLDILAARASFDYGATVQPLQVLTGDGKGGFTDATARLFKDGIPYVNFVPRIFAADFNNDGMTDIFNPDFGMDAPPFPGGQNSLYLSNKQTGQLSNETKTLPQALQQNHGTSVGDVNNDGYLDLFVNALNNTQGKANELLINDGTGHFISSQHLMPASMTRTGFDPGNTWSGIADVNNDGWNDLLIGAWDSNPAFGTRILLNDGKGSFADAVAIELPRSGVPDEIVLDIKTIDLNGDALPDLMLSISNGGARATWYQTQYIQLLVNQGNGKFVDETATRFPQKNFGTSDAWYKSLTAVDMNGDGFQDIVADHTGGGLSKVLLNDGHGKFTVGWTSTGTEHIAVADIDGDGMPDIVSANDYGYSILFNVMPRTIGASHVYRATARGDTVNGTAAAETIYAGAGNDMIDGGAGLDRVVYEGKRGAATVKLDAGKITVTGASGTDQLTHVERVVFSDGALAFDADGVAGKAYRIYQAAFNRKPDAGGLGFWLSVMDGGSSVDQVAENFVASKEFKDLYGANPSNKDFLTKLYFNVLHREGDPGGFAYWLDILDRKALSSAQVLALFSESPENVAALATVIGQGMEYQPFG